MKYEQNIFPVIEISINDRDCHSCYPTSKKITFCKFSPHPCLLPSCQNVCDMPCCVSNTNFQTFLSLDPIPGSWLAISAACSSCNWPAPNLFWAQLAPLAMMHTHNPSTNFHNETHLKNGTLSISYKYHAAFSTRVDIIFKGLEIWMFAEFYYFPLALIANYGPGMILFWLWPGRMPSGRI